MALLRHGQGPLVQLRHGGLSASRRWGGGGGVYGLGLGVWGFGLRVWGLGFGVRGLGFGVWS